MGQGTQSFSVSKQILALIGAGLLALSIVISSSVFAAIPHSTTKMISACRDNSTGALKVIDAENSATCGGSETLLTWGGEQTAVVHISNDSNSNYPFEYDAELSRNAATVVKVSEVGALDGFCVDLPFTPIHSSDSQNTFYQGNLELSQDMTDFCGENTNYEAFIFGGVGSYFFTE